MMNKKIHNVILTSLALVPMWGAGTLYAETQQKDEIGNYRREGIDVVQQRVFRKGLRHEFTIDGGYIFDNQFLRYELAQTRYTFHFREGLAFEGSYSKVFHQERAIIRDLANAKCPPNTDIDGDGIPDTNCGRELEPSPDPIQNMYFANIVWSPIYGKFSIFSKKIYHFDLFFVAGAGMFDNQRSKQFAINIGLGAKIFLNHWLALRTEFRNITVREGAPFNHIVNDRIASLGISFFLPPNPYE